MSSYKPQFAVASLLSLGLTLFVSLFTGGTDKVGAFRTAALALLATSCGMLIFVLP